MHFTGAISFALDYVVVNTQKVFSLQGGFQTSAMHHHRKNLIKLTHNDETKKRANDSQIVRTKENLKLSYDGPSLGYASCTNQRIKVKRQGRHCA